MNYHLIAPAGAPLPVSAVLSSLSRRTAGTYALVEVLQQQLGVRHIFTLSSGRAALTVLLEALKKCSDRREVVIPAYTCFSVPSAVVRAGLSLRFCDVDPKTLDLDQKSLARLDLAKVLCIIPSGLYGMPSDLISLEEITRASGAFLVDDSALCLGATLAGRACGTFGDAGFFSLGRGKNVTTMGGGILVTQREDLAQLIREDVTKLPHSSFLSILSSVLNSLIYSAMLSPSRYWLLDRISFLGLGISVFDSHFEMMQLSSYQKRLAVRLLTLVKPYNSIRHENARKLHDGIKAIEGIEIPQPSKGAHAVYLRFPLLARDEKHRARLIWRLKNAGIGATASYPSAIGDIPGIRRYLAVGQQDCPGAQLIAERIITLPTHPYVTALDIERMVQVISTSK